MQVVVEAKPLAQAALAAKGAADRGSLPGLHRLLLEADSETQQLRVAGTDLEAWVGAHVPAGVQAGGAVTVDARLLAGLAAQLPDGQVELSAGDGKVAVRCGPVRFELQAAGPEDFPAPPDVGDGPEVRAGAGRLLEAMRVVEPCMMESKYPSALAGMLFKAWGGTLTLAATDGNRLAHRELDAEGGPEEPVSRILAPVKPLMDLLRSTNGSVTLRFGERLMAVEHERWRLVSRLMEGSFPPHTQFFIEAPATRAVFSREEFARSVKRLSLLARNGPPVVLMNVGDGAVRLSAVEADMGRGEDVVAARTEGPAVQAAYKARYLLELCSAVDSEELVYEVGDPQRQAQFRRSTEDRSFWQVVMPVRLADSTAQAKAA